MRKLLGILAAVTLTVAYMVPVALADGQGDHFLNVDGVVYQPTKVVGKEDDPTVHYETKDINPSSAFTERNTWEGHGSEHLPCADGIHWVDNKNLLTVSNCLDGDGTTTTSSTSTTVPEGTTTSQPTTTTTEATTTTSVDDTTTTTSQPETTTTVPETTTTLPDNTTTTVVDTPTTTTEQTTTSTPETTRDTLPFTGPKEVLRALGILALALLGVGSLIVASTKK